MIKSKKILSKYQLFLLLLPAIIYLIIFHYIPIGGLIIAFKNYNPFLGIFKSEWVGFEKFNVFFSSYYFWTIISNTLRISFVALIFNTLVPIIFALLVNEVQNKKFKSFIQTITYTPHFISLVVLVGMINTLFAFDGGAINNILTFFNLKPIDFLGTPKYFVWLFTFSGLWQSMGWWAIIYIGTLSNIDPSLHEAAVID
ncbi:MAG: hypothetical protein WC907_03660, partial [Acholeplasmataceae bacterium]